MQTRLLAGGGGVLFNIVASFSIAVSLCNLGFSGMFLFSSRGLHILPLHLFRLISYVTGARTGTEREQAPPKK